MGNLFLKSEGGFKNKRGNEKNKKNSRKISKIFPIFRPQKRAIITQGVIFLGGVFWGVPRCPDPHAPMPCFNYK